MTLLRHVLVWLMPVALMVLQVDAQAQTLRAVETGPAENAVIRGRSEDFFVRFDKPIDHIRSTLVIRRGDQIVETLHPRLNTEPEVLFARAPALPPGEYTLEWLVKSLDGREQVQGTIAFTVAPDRRAAI